MERLTKVISLLLVLCAPAAATTLAQKPNPSLSPQAVVRIQIEALRDNDTPYKDRGIEVTFAFASPTNKRTTGPLARFKAMVRGPAYRSMIGHRGATYENVKIEGGAARIDVILTTRRGKILGYRFILSRQRGNAHAGSWMTDGVIRFPVTSL